MARIGKSDKLKNGVYVSKISGNLMIIKNPWLEQFYNTKTRELLQLNTAIIETVKTNPTRAILDENAINDLEYIGKL